MGAGLLLGFPGAQDGLSAYEEALANGFVGTEQQWLDSLVGAQGVPGQNSTVPGPQGQPGQQGPPGQTGPAGAGTAFNIVSLNDAENLGNNIPFTPSGSSKPLFLSVILKTGQRSNQGALWSVTWYNNNTVVRNFEVLAGNNVNNENDGGSGMTNVTTVMVPFVNGSNKLIFQKVGGSVAVAQSSLKFIALITSDVVNSQ